MIRTKSHSRPFELISLNRFDEFEFFLATNRVTMLANYCGKPFYVLYQLNSSPISFTSSILIYVIHFNFTFCSVQLNRLLLLNLKYFTERIFYLVNSTVSAIAIRICLSSVLNVIVIASLVSPFMSNFSNFRVISTVDSDECGSMAKNTKF